MKIFFITYYLIFFICSCSTNHQNVGEVTQTPNEMILTEPKPKVYQDENGNFINEEGWENPKFEKDDERFLGSDILKNKEGKSVRSYHYSYAPKMEVVIKEPFYSSALNTKNSPAKLLSVIEVKGKNQPPYCYSFFIRKIVQKAPVEIDVKTESHNHMVVYRICDADGDGIFETRPIGNFTIPTWVK